MATHIDIGNDGTGQWEATIRSDTSDGPCTEATGFESIAEAVAWVEDFAAHAGLDLHGARLSAP